jgi:hypothetical protein
MKATDQNTLPTRKMFTDLAMGMPGNNFDLNG